MTFHDLSAQTIDHKPVQFSIYKGKVVLVVNVASKCGLTPQYNGLEALYEKYKDRGFVILGFPCNQFGAQEPGTNIEIADFCSKSYGVTFPMFDKVDVNGANTNSVYTFLKKEQGVNDIEWNFGKFLVDKDGHVAQYFGPRTTPEELENDIKKLL